MVDKQEKQALRGRQGVREFEPQDTVFIRNYLTGPKWLPGVVTEITGPVSYKVRTIDGRFWKRHVDQIRSRQWSTYLEEEPATELPQQQRPLSCEPRLSDEPVEERPLSTSKADFSAQPTAPEETPVATSSSQLPRASEPRRQEVLPTSAHEQERPSRPQRQRQRPNYLKDYVT
ncbi:unnamed protein product [Ixodes persulcatus]